MRTETLLGSETPIKPSWLVWGNVVLLFLAVAALVPRLGCLGVS